MGTEDAVRFQNEVMNGVYGDNPYGAMFNHRHHYDSALDFSGEQDLLVIADGVVLKTDGFLTALNLTGCKNVTVRGLTIDCKRRPYTVGTVCNAGNGFFDIRFPENANVSPAMPAPRFIIMDTEQEHIRFLLSAAHDSRKEKAAVEKNVIRFFYQLDPAYVGYPIAVLHTWHGCPSVLIEESRNVTLENITVLSHPGMGIVGHRCENLTLDSVRVIPAEGAFVSTNTDASHFSSCRGSLIIRNCTFRGSGDDCINIHGYYQTVRERLGETSYRLKVMVRYETHSLHLDHPDAGDIVTYVHADDLQPYETYRVLSVEPDQDTFSCTVTLDRPLPEDAAGNLLACYEQFPRVEITGCRFSDHLARGMLLQTPKGGVVENCEFSHAFENAIHFTADPGYQESAPSDNITVRNCHTVRCGIRADNLAPKKERPVHSHITITDNSIDGAVVLSSIDGLTWKNNRTSIPPKITDCVLTDETILSETEQ